MPKTIEERVYELMCAGCEKEHYCHNACETCDEYADEVERLYEEEKMTQEKREQFWEGK